MHKILCGFMQQKPSFLSPKNGKTRTPPPLERYGLKSKLVPIYVKLQVNIKFHATLSITDKPLGECLFLTGSPYTVTTVTGTSLCFS